MLPTFGQATRTATSKAATISSRTLGEDSLFVQDKPKMSSRLKKRHDGSDAFSAKKRQPKPGAGTESKPTRTREHRGLTNGVKSSKRYALDKLSRAGSRASSHSDHSRTVNGSQLSRISNLGSKLPLTSEPEDPLRNKIIGILSANDLHPPKWPDRPGEPSSQQAMSRFRELHEAYRREVRAALTRAGVIDDPDKRKRLSEAIDFKGICDEMCPEYEKITRITEHDVNKPERDPETDFPFVSTMIKKLARSAAGQEAPLPMDVRSASALRQTLDYVVDELLTCDEDLVTLHGFLWDRTRAIRRDFAFFSTMTNEELLTQVYVLENIARFHVISLHLLSRLEKPEEVFVEQQELEQLGKALLSLRDLYDDCNESQIECPNEEKFRAYYLLFHGRDPGILETLQRQWNPQLWQDSDEIRTAVSLIEALQTTSEFIGSSKHGDSGPMLAASGAQPSYFTILKDESISYIMACFAECHFPELRRSILATVKRALSRPKALAQDMTAEALNELLQFDTIDQAIAFARLHGLEFVADDEQPEQLGRKIMILNGRHSLPHVRLNHQFSYDLVERKRGRRSLSNIIHDAVPEGGETTSSTSSTVQYLGLSQLRADPSRGVPSEQIALGVQSQKPLKISGYNRSSQSHKQTQDLLIEDSDDDGQTLSSSHNNPQAAQMFKSERVNGEDGRSMIGTTPARSNLRESNTGSNKFPNTSDHRSGSQGFDFSKPFPPEVGSGVSKKPNPFAPGPIPSLNTGFARPTASKANPFAGSLPSTKSNPFLSIAGTSSDVNPAAWTNSTFQKPLSTGSFQEAGQTVEHDAKFSSRLAAVQSNSTLSTKDPDTDKPDGSLNRTRSTIETVNSFGNLSRIEQVVTSQEQTQSKDVASPKLFATSVRPAEKSASISSATLAVKVPTTASLHSERNSFQTAVPSAPASLGSVISSKNILFNTTNEVARQTTTFLPAIPGKSSGEPPLLLTQSSSIATTEGPPLDTSSLGNSVKPQATSDSLVIGDDSRSDGLEAATRATLKQPTSRNALDQLNEWFVKGDHGLLSDFVIETVRRMTYEVFQTFKEEEEERVRIEEEKRTEAEVEKFRVYNLTLKFFYRWKRNARAKRLRELRRKEREDMRVFVASQRAAARERRAEETPVAENTVQKANNSDPSYSGDFMSLIRKRRRRESQVRADPSPHGESSPSSSKDKGFASQRILRDDPDSRTPSIAERKTVDPSTEVPQKDGPKTRALRAKLFGRPDNLRRSLPSTSQASDDGSGSLKQFHFASPYWALRAMGILPMPDGSALPDSLAREEADRTGGEQLTAASWRPRSQAHAAALHASALKSSFPSSSADDPPVGSSQHIWKSSQGAMRSNIEATTSKQQDAVEIHSDKSSPVAEVSQQQATGDTEHSARNKRKRNDDDDDGAKTEAPFQDQIFRDADRISRELREIRAELEEGTAWYRDQNQQFASISARSVSRGGTPSFFSTQQSGPPFI